MSFEIRTTSDIAKMLTSDKKIIEGMEDSFADNITIMDIVTRKGYFDEEKKTVKVQKKY